MLPAALGVIAAFVALSLVVIARKPNQFRISRSAIINAPANEVFAHINNMKKWVSWSPWAQMDPGCRYVYEGPEAGNGAVCSWAGNKKVGEGRMTVIESNATKLIRMKLEFFKPFQAINTAEFELAAEGNRTHVTWSMMGDQKFMCKVFGLIMNMDKMVGKDFEKGLSNLDALVRRTPGEAAIAA